MLNNVMLVLAVALSLSFLVTEEVRAQGTPDGETPAEETVCDIYQGAAFGLCNAYCEAMDCDSGMPNASEVACEQVLENFMEITDEVLTCEPKECHYSAHDGSDAAVEASGSDAPYCIATDDAPTS